MRRKQNPGHSTQHRSQVQRASEKQVPGGASLDWPGLQRPQEGTETWLPAVLAASAGHWEGLHRGECGRNANRCRGKKGGKLLTPRGSSERWLQLGLDYPLLEWWGEGWGMREGEV